MLSVTIDWAQRDPYIIPPPLNQYYIQPWCEYCSRAVTSSGMDPGFPVWGLQTRWWWGGGDQCLTQALFGKNACENERTGSHLGGVPGTSPGSANAYGNKIGSHLHFSTIFFHPSMRLVPILHLCLVYIISLHHSVNGDFCGHSRFVLWHENLTTFVSWTFGLLPNLNPVRGGGWPELHNLMCRKQ